MKTQVLLVGYDPEAVDFSNPALLPGMSVEKIRDAVLADLEVQDNVRDQRDLGHAHAAVVRRLDKLGGFDKPVFLGRDLNLSVDQTDFYALNARLAPEVLLHPVCSKVSSHTFDAHFEVFDLCLRDRRKRAAKQQQ